MGRTVCLALVVVVTLARTAAADPARDLELEIEGALTEGAVGDALTASEQAIAQYPQRAETWYQRGSALFQAARMREAADAFRQALKRRRDWPDATVKLATAVWLLGDPDTAHELVLPALRRAPKHDELRRLDEALDMDLACRKNFWRSLDEKSPQWAGAALPPRPQAGGIRPRPHQRHRRPAPGPLAARRSADQRAHRSR